MTNQIDFSFFSDAHSPYGKNKLSSTFENFTLLRNEKGKNLSKSVGRGVAVLFLEYTFVVRVRKGFTEIISLKNKILYCLRLLRSSRHLWNKNLTFWQMHRS